jgi:hypothetical protein
MRVTASEEVEQPFPLARERTVAGLEKVLVMVLWCQPERLGAAVGEVWDWQEPSPLSDSPVTPDTRD